MIHLTAISRVFHMGDQDVSALAGINLEIMSGEYVSIMGPSGSGKSTLLNIIGLLDRPDSGRYELDGKDVTDLSETEQARVRREKIGFVFQSFHLVPRLTAAENIELPLILEGVPPAERRSRVQRRWRDSTWETVPAIGRLNFRAASDSGWPLRARLFSVQPPCWRMSPPAISITASVRKSWRCWKVCIEAGTTLIVVTHDRELGARAQRHIAMRDGEIVADEA